MYWQKNYGEEPVGAETWRYFKLRSNFPRDSDLGVEAIQSMRLTCTRGVRAGRHAALKPQVQREKNGPAAPYDEVASATIHSAFSRLNFDLGKP